MSSDIEPFVVFTIDGLHGWITHDSIPRKRTHLQSAYLIRCYCNTLDPLSRQYSQMVMLNIMVDTDLYLDAINIGNEPAQGTTICVYL